MMTGNDYFCITAFFFIQKQLKETYYVFFILFWVTIGVGLHALMLRKGISYLLVISQCS